MFSLLMSKAKIVAVTVVSEMHGKNRVAGCCVTFEVSTNNLILSEFDSQLRHALYSVDLDQRLQPQLVDDNVGGLVALKCPKLGMPLRWDWEGAGYELTLHIGASGRNDIVLTDVGLKDFSFDCKDGGTVITKFKALAHPNAVEQGKIDHMLQLETEISLRPPSDKQSSIAA